jgi:hypothetical protein
MSASEAQQNANRENAQHSTGPRTETGKAKASLNAVKTGLTGQTVLLPTDDTQAYKDHLARHFTRLAPVTDEENTLVQFIADTEWRLLRIAPLEASIYAIGRRELGHMVEDEANPINRDALLTGYIFQTYRKDLSNLALQERRLRNQHKADSEKLQSTQQGRLDKEKAAAAKRQADMQRAIAINEPFDPAEIGFEFSLAEINHYRSKIDHYRKLTGQLPTVDKVIAAFRKEQKAA